MKIFAPLLALLIASAAQGSEVGNYQNAAALNGSERFLADQGGTLGVPSTTGITVNISPSQILSYIIPAQSGESGNCLSTNGTSLQWATCGSGGSGAFSALTSGTNTSAAMLVGTGS